MPQREGATMACQRIAPKPGWFVSARAMPDPTKKPNKRGKEKRVWERSMKKTGGLWGIEIAAPGQRGGRAGLKKGPRSLGLPRPALSKYSKRLNRKGAPKKKRFASKKNDCLAQTERKKRYISRAMTPGWATLKKKAGGMVERVSPRGRGLTEGGAKRRQPKEQ